MSTQLTRLQEKLNRLREEYSTNERALMGIDDDEKVLRDLIELKKFSKHPIVKIILQDAQKHRDEIDTLLTQDEELNTPEAAYRRFAIFRERIIWDFILDRFGGKTHEIDMRLEIMENELDVELER